MGGASLQKVELIGSETPLVLLTETLGRKTVRKLSGDKK